MCACDRIMRYALHTQTTTYSPEFCLPFAISDSTLLSPFGWGKVEMTCFELLKVSRVKVTKGDQFNISVNVIPVLTFIHTHIIYIYMRLLCVHACE